MPKCEPVQCDITDYTGQSRTVDSYGRRKKRDLGLVRRTKRRAEMEEALVVSTLHIVDRLAARQDSLQRNLFRSHCPIQGWTRNDMWWKSRNTVTTS